MKAASANRPLFNDPVAGRCYARRELSTGETAWVIPTIYNARLIVGDETTVSRFWCYAGPDGIIRACTALNGWDGVGDPPGWNKNGQTQEWREP